ncbi:serine/threonine-protein kinase [Lyngbya confervoides]|uniref:Serine/threonine-protein kinase n=1 Tax=Lyngbya confervoides BDU141951 TaxID=1574623 RepID=A0ABD4T3N8_9CYAN|nr:serine/threonine-protein kinase [Lyngbya confervoides]MCM1982842.1 serine/threonine-protein kinase [Lyngbya confervoides BDU141951]
MLCIKCGTRDLPDNLVVCPTCGVYLPGLFRDLLAPGTELDGGKYRIEYALGRGGFGITYRAYHQGFSRSVAIKEYFPQDFAHREGSSGSLITPTTGHDSYERWLARFKREGQILFDLSHPNIVRVQNLFEERNTVYLVMELLTGRTLGEELSSFGGRGLPEQRVVAIMDALTAALSVVHQRNLFHLDIKPANVMVTQDGRIVLLDFGAARQEVSRTRGQSKYSSLALSENYAPPELMAAEGLNSATDIFELAMMLHELLTGTLPPSSIHRVLHPVDPWHCSLCEPWCSMVNDALRLEVGDRPQNVQAWWGRYRHWHQKQAELAKLAPRPSPHRGKWRDLWQRPKTKMIAMITVVAIAALGFVVGGAMVTRVVVRWITTDSTTAKADPPPLPTAEITPERTAQDWFDQANEKADQEDYEGAIADYTKAIELNPSWTSAYINRGFARRLARDYSGAIVDYTKALDLNPDSSLVYNNRGFARRLSSDNVGAIADYNKALEINKDWGSLGPWVAHTNRGVARRATGDHSGAIADYDQAIQIKPDYAYAYYVRGLARQVEKDYSSAIADYNKAIELDPKDSDAYFNRALARQDSGDYAGAIADYDKALEITPDDADAYYNRGLAYKSLGNVQASLSNFRAAATRYQSQGNEEWYQKAQNQITQLSQ